MEQITKSYPLEWDKVSERLYELGNSKGVLFPIGTKGVAGEGVAWNGLVSVKQAPDGAEAKPIYANDKVYIQMTSKENFKGTIEAYTYPEEFKSCDGSKEIRRGVYAGQQNRQSFNLAYSTIIGNDTEGEGFGEKIHLIYNAKVAPSSRDYTTINEDPEALLFSWEFSTTPEGVGADLEAKGFKPTAYIEIDTTLLEDADVKTIKDILYGTEGTAARMPKISEILTLLPELDPEIGG